ncbi:TonB-dependent siderophore receptor, partial [Chroococcidiopsis sp. CCALA 051]|uniref:TonB-dependent siderophore receptor n=1 Tax=Chroococcidiopsis sp. CCALA 051 TaxID=869949 RepID=UPI000D0CAB9F
CSKRHSIGSMAFLSTAKRQKLSEVLLNEAIKNVPGATQTAPNYIPGFAGFTIRGFSVGDYGPNVTRNGLSYGVPAGTQASFSDIERVEVLRGPASVLFGQGDPGGTINIVSKQPLRDPFYSVEATIGSYNRYGGAIDLTGPLNDSKTALYRLNASYEEAESFVDFVEPETSAVAGALKFELGEKTELKFDSQYIKINQSYPSGLPAIGTVLDNPNGEIKRDRNFSSEDSEYSPEVFRVGYDLEHRLSENWSLRNAFYFSTLEQKIRGIGVDSLEPDLRTLLRQGDDRDYNEEILDLFTNIVGKFSTGAIEHQLLFGVDLRRSNYTDVTLRTFQGTPIDVFNPIYSSQRLEIIDRPSDNEVTTDSIGIYLQDQITLADNFKLLLGGRFDAFEQTDEDRIEDTETSQSGDAFSPRLGVVYQPIEPISLYASYTRSFIPSYGRSADDELFEPGRGTQYEVGVKADISDRLSATLALYDLTRTNVNTTDPDNPDFEIQTGEQNSQGVELFVSGEILPGWNIIGGYAYTDARITQDETFAIGNRINNVAESSFNLWTSYEIQSGNLQGLGFGLGFFYVGDRQGDLDNSFTLPSYFRTDAAIFYNRGQFRAALNFRNLFDVDYFESAYSDLSLYPGEPFTVLGTVSWQF